MPIFFTTQCVPRQSLQNRKMNDLQHDDLSCQICMNNGMEKRLTACGHGMCSTCLTGVFTTAVCVWRSRRGCNHLADV
jgi:hypothetical protein